MQTNTCKSLSVASNSNCPSNQWKQDIYDLFHRDKMSIINIGANTGSNVNEFLNEHNPSWNVSAKLWHQESKTGCGVCGACKTKLFRGPKSVKSIRALAIELLHTNFLVISHNFKMFDVPGFALHAAAGAKMGTSIAPRLTKVGTENFGISPNSKNGDTVPMVSVDGLMTMFGWNSAVDFLSIDTEGHGAWVLEGANRGLQAKMFRVIEFEYHGVGRWRTTSLNVTVGNLMRYGYTCFWQGREAIAQYEVECDNEFRKWSNLLCAHEHPIVAKLKSQSRSGS